MFSSTRRRARGLRPRHKRRAKDFIYQSPSRSGVSGISLHFPTMATAYRKIAFLPDILEAQDLENIDETSIALIVRSLLTVDLAKKVRMTMIYPASFGWNTFEVLRVINSSQKTDGKGVTSDWKVGDDVIVPPIVSMANARNRSGKLEG